MGFQARKNLHVIVHPYIFVLKEGKKIKKDYLDYSLMMLQITAPETIKSPHDRSKKRLNMLAPELDLLKAILSSPLKN